MRFWGVRSPHQHRGHQGGAQGQAMTVPMLTLLVLLVAFRRGGRLAVPVLRASPADLERELRLKPRLNPRLAGAHALPSKPKNSSRVNHITCAPVGVA
jgi:hypothetical protein